MKEKQPTCKETRKVAKTGKRGKDWAWLKEGMEEAAAEVESWPEWLKGRKL